MPHGCPKRLGDTTKKQLPLQNETGTHKKGQILALIFWEKPINPFLLCLLRSEAVRRIPIS